MARISSYGLDSKPELGDKVVGTDTSAEANLKTKNYSLQDVVDLFNKSNSVALADQSIFLFQDDLSEGREAGTVSFEAGGGVGTAFSSITSLIFSKSALGGANIANFLQLFSNKSIIIAEVGNINNHGRYKVTNISDFSLDPTFYEIQLSVNAYNGVLSEDAHYIFSEFSVPGAESTLQTTIDAGNTYQETASSPLWTWGNSALLIDGTGTPGGFYGVLSGKYIRLKSDDFPNYTSLGNGSLVIPLPGAVNTRFRLTANPLIEEGEEVGILSPATSGTLALTTDIIDSPWDTVLGGINYAGGNVGIGTTGPLAKLHVFGGSAIIGDDDFNAVKISANGSGTTYNTIGNGFIAPNVNFNINNQTKLTINGTTGNVGIGTTSPSQKLEVAGDVKISGSIYDSNNSPGTSGQILSSTGTSLDWVDNVSNATSAEKVTLAVRFEEAVSKGDPVYVSGFHGSNGPVLVSKARSDDPTKMPSFGLADDDYAQNAEGHTVTIGNLDDVDTDAYDIGDTLYVAPTGGLTDVKPTGSNLIQNVGTVSRSNQNNGSIEVTATGRSNDVPNLTTGKIWVGSAANTIESATVHLDETNSRMGIGAASPSYNLDVIGDAKISTWLYVNNIYPVSSTNDLLLNTGAGRTITLNPTSTGKTVIPSGNVGIGTTSPSKKLQVDGTVHLGSSGNDVTIGATNSSVIYMLRSGYNYIQASDASGALMFRTGGANNRMIIDSSGNVGIGTTSPSVKLHVDSGDIETIAYFKSSDNRGRISIADNDTTSYIISEGSKMSLGTVASLNTSNLTIDSSGKVGIGTISPSYALDVVGSLNNIAKLTSSTTKSQLLLVDANSTDTVAIGSEGDDFNVRVDNGDINLQTGSGATATTRVKINSSGNVGIGTTSPSYKLSVDGDVQSDIIRGYTFPTNSFLDFDDDQTASLNHTRLASIGRIAYLADTNTNEPAANAAHEFFTGTSDIDTATSLMIIETGGNVGIGTTSPSEKLEVNGDIAIRDAIGALNFIYSSTPTRIARLDSDNGNLRIKADINSSQANSFISFDIDASEKMRITSGGNVGIGTTSPDTPLHVDLGTVDVKAQLDAIGGFDGMLVDGTNASYNLIGGNGDKYSLGVVNAGDFRIYNEGGAGYSFVLQNTGFIGIGTTSPQEKLDISAGNIRLDNNRELTWATTDANVGRVRITGNESTDSISFATDNSVRMALTNTGLGIGTTSPASKLEVDGGDIEIDDSASGLILRSPDGTRYRVTVANGGTLTVTAV